MEAPLHISHPGAGVPVCRSRRGFWTRVANLRRRRVSPRLARPVLSISLVLVLLLVGAVSLFPAVPARAQVDVNIQPSVTVHAALPSGETAVPQGALAAFEIRRSGNLSGATAVRVQTREPFRQVGFGSNPSERNHIVNFEPDVTTETLYVPVLGDSDGANHGSIQALVQGHSTYTQGSPREAWITIRAATDDDVIVTIAPSESSIAEGDDAEFTLTRTGGTSSTLTAAVRAEDPDQAMRGNHWDPAPQAADLSRDVTFAADAGAATVSFPTRPNQRDTGDLTLTAEVQPDGDHSFWVGADFAADVTVTDDDTAPEFSLSVSPTEMDEGEEVTFTLTRHGDASQALEEVPFALRIGADRSRLVYPDWVDPQDYGVAMAAGQSALEFSFTAHFDGAGSKDFRFEAEFNLTRDIPAALAGEYFTVRGRPQGWSGRGKCGITAGLGLVDRQRGI